MLLGFRLKATASGWGVISPLTLRDPFSLIFVSSDTGNGRVRSRLALSICSDSGARRTFTDGFVLRSSAEILASFKSNLPSSNCHGVPAATGAVVVSCGAPPAAGAGDGAGVAGTAPPGVAGAAAGAAIVVVDGADASLS